LDVVADSDAAYVAMHWRAHSNRMQDRATYDDEGGVVSVVAGELAARAAAVEAAGVPRERVVLDPGLGFAKHPRHNWQLLRHLDELDRLGYPLLLGASRKSFLGSLLADPDGTPRDVGAREFAHVGLITWAALRGVWGIRVHDVRACVDALAVITELNPRSVGEPATAGEPL
jgi:dihydropteroate synthase